MGTARIKEYAKTADYEQGWEFFLTIESPNAFDYTAALNLCARAAWFKRAVDLWDKMPVTSKDVVAYSSMIDVYARCRRADAAESLFQEMEQANEVTPNLITYTSMINACGMAGQPEKALDYFTCI